MRELGNIASKDLVRIDEICDRFQSAWSTGEQPRLEDFLAEADDVPQVSLIRELVATEMELFVRAGQPVPLADYCKRFPYPGIVTALYRSIVPPSIPSSPSIDCGIAEPQHLRDYQLLEEIGKGGFGTVYKAVHTKLAKIVAIKILPLHGPHGSNGIARFEREMQAVGSLEHPNIVRAMDAGEIDGRHYLAMEFVNGPTLASLIKSRGPLPIREACELIRQAALALDAAHARGIVHRDVKPANFILAGISPPQARSVAIKSGGTTIVNASSSDHALTIPTLKLLDLGLAQLHDYPTELTTETQLVGTVDYMAPEQATPGNNIGPAADIYSLGCTLFALLIGRAPFADADHASVTQKIYAHLSESPPRIDLLRPDAPPLLVEIFKRMTARQPADRYASAGAVVEAIAPLAAGAELLILQTPPKEPSRAIVRSPRSLAAETTETIPVRATKRKWLLPATALILCVLIALTAFRPQGAQRSVTDITQANDFFPSSAGVYPAAFPSNTGAGSAEMQTLVARATQRQEHYARQLKVPVEIKNSIGIGFRLIPPGDFLMGFSEEEVNGAQDKPQHPVTISSAFYMGATEVTVAEFKKFVQETGYKTAVELPGKAVLDVRLNPLPGVTWQTLFTNEQKADADWLPVVCVTWHDADAFCEWLSNREGHRYRLPNDAEWEYACRAGSTTPFWWGSEFDPHFILVLSETAVPGRQRVGIYPPNPFGLFDMHGNVWEWCRDGRRTYTTTPVVDPSSPADPAEPRVVRGGGFLANPLRKRSAHRAADAPDMATPVKGFRIVREIEPN